MVMETRWFRPQINDIAKAYRLDPAVVEAVVRVESSGLAHAYRYEPAFFERYLADDPRYANQNPRRVSASYGLMQIMYPVAVENGFVGDPEMLFVPEASLAYGCKHLAKLYQWSGGEMAPAVAAYNGGKRGNRQPPYRNRGYVHKVLIALDLIRKDRL